MSTPTPSSAPSVNRRSSSPSVPHERTFAEDVAFLREHRETLVLKAPGASGGGGGGQIAVVPGIQGRVMTSTAGGAGGAGVGGGRSYGFIKDEVIAQQTPRKHINPHGGEDRFWIGPEGGQYSIFFPPTAKDGKPVPQTLEHWQTPAAIDTDAFTLTAQTASSATFEHRATLVNASGTVFGIKVDRTIEVLDLGRAMQELGVGVGAGVRGVAFESRNTLTNVGAGAWTKETGLLSIWILGMFKPGPRTVVIIPVKGGEVGGVVAINDRYFGKVPAARLKRIARGPVVGEAKGSAGAAGGSAFLYLGDGQERGKIGIPPSAAMPVVGSFDPGDGVTGVLTLCAYTLPVDAAERPYVNSMWENPQPDPYAGDVVNSYNDGPSTPGGEPFGPFYEIETSSPTPTPNSPSGGFAPGSSFSHTHRTIHLEGPHAALDQIARAVLGVSLRDAVL